ncbi:hypothetical protein EJ04DRAFT_67947 [Polyplosphaeria fusca]|uniref:Rab-GAP TBC domain-containing protein n=1 Tax=Polyplosphaeria fusca TaxID=682080 RepID=A0A9P4V6A1_9PLEO|nr:hypothetical protein EJ04DRAFT_67947 [Polyplosphaeria fusca]
MAEPRLRTESPESTGGSDSSRSYGTGSDHMLPLRSYVPPEAEYTPPASPQPSSLHHPAPKNTFGAQRRRHPPPLPTGTPNSEPYNPPTHSPTPSSSPPLAPALPSPHLPLRQRHAELLRNGPAHNQRHSRASQHSDSPTLSTFPNAPVMMRQGSGQGPTTDPRMLFNPLASNPVQHLELRPQPAREDSWMLVQNRARGLTSSSNPYPPLRSATSIQDYTVVRNGERSHLSGTYRPNRGGANANWSHNENYPALPVRPPNDPRTSSWTNASSFLEASGTERSSVATRRSSISDSQSLASKELPELPDPEPENDIVDDVLDYYCESPTEGYPGFEQEPERQNDEEAKHAPSENKQFKREALKELSQLPRLPDTKGRLSRQDLAQFQAYSSKYVKKRGPSIEEESSRPMGTAQAPVSKTEVLPKVDEDAVRPRRASTSVFDRRSAFLDLGKMASPTKPAQDGVERPTGKHTSERTLVARISATVHERDKYGFKKATEKITVEQYNAWSDKYDDYVTRRTSKWTALLQKHGLPTDNPRLFPDRCEKVKRYVRKGIPPEWRGHMWYFYALKQFDLSEVQGIYPTLVARVKNGELNKDDKEAIERDLDRTFPDNIHFRPDHDNFPQETGTEPQMIRNLREVLQCFALHNPQIGYCQSLNFIGGLLLLFLKNDLERVFILMHVITKHHLPHAHDRNLTNTEVKILMSLIKDYLPKVWTAINDTDIINSGFGANAHPEAKFSRLPSVNIACTAWFMSVFLNVLPIEPTLRIWDTFFYEGPRTLFKHGLAIFKLAEPALRKLDASNMAEICMTMQDVPRRTLDPGVLYDLVFVKKYFSSIDNSLIMEKRTFWRIQAQEKSGAKDEVRALQKTSTTGLRRKASRRFRRRG